MFMKLQNKIKSTAKPSKAGLEELNVLSCCSELLCCGRIKTTTIGNIYRCSCKGSASSCKVREPKHFSGGSNPRESRGEREDTFQTLPNTLAQGTAERGTQHNCLLFLVSAERKPGFHSEKKMNKDGFQIIYLLLSSLSVKLD